MTNQLWQHEVKYPAGTLLYDHLEKTWCVIICWIPDTTRAIVLSGKDHLEKWSYFYVIKSHIT